MRNRLSYAFVLPVLLMMTAYGASAQNYQRFGFGQSELARMNTASYYNDGPSAYLYSKYSFRDGKTYGENPLDLTAGFGLTTKAGIFSFEIGHDGYSNFDRHALQLNYGYGWDFGNWGNFSISAGLSLPVDVINWDKMDYSPDLTGRSTCCAPDLNLGFEYDWGAFRLGLSMLNLCETRTGPESFRIGRNPRVVMVYLFYNSRLINDEWGISPYIIAGYCEQIAFDIGLYFDWKKIVSFGYTFRAIFMENMFNVNVAIPHTFLDLNVAYAKNMFNSQQSLSFGLKFRLPDLRYQGEKRAWRKSL